MNIDTVNKIIINSHLLCNNILSCQILRMEKMLLLLESSICLKSNCKSLQIKSHLLEKSYYYVTYLL